MYSRYDSITFAIALLFPFLTVIKAHADVASPKPVGAALQAALDDNPSQRAQIAREANALGLQVVEVTTGLGSWLQKVLVVSGSGKSFTDCGDELQCPEMVVVPETKPDSMVGSPQDEPQRLATEARHSVSFGAFAIGRYEVSVGQYMECVNDGGCRYPEWAEPDGQHNIETGTGVTYKSVAPYISKDQQPVVGVSWDDATAYAAWLSASTGYQYRLPSETEWEYAARAGSPEPYWWGDSPKRGSEVMACCDGCGSERDMVGLFPVHSFKPNPWGLHNVHGNVWEWVADYFCENFATSPSDGRARVNSKCPKQRDPEGLRVFRGGSCFYGPRQMRASMRLRHWPNMRRTTVGFRVARSIDGQD